MMAYELTPVKTYAAKMIALCVADAAQGGYGFIAPDEAGELTEDDRAAAHKLVARIAHGMEANPVVLIALAVEE